MKCAGLFLCGRWAIITRCSSWCHQWLLSDLSLPPAGYKAQWHWSLTYKNSHSFNSYSLIYIIIFYFSSWFVMQGPWFKSHLWPAILSSCNKVSLLTNWTPTPTSMPSVLIIKDVCKKNKKLILFSVKLRPINGHAIKIAICRSCALFPN